jgi:hypothetical protein
LKLNACPPAGTALVFLLKRMNIRAEFEHTIIAGLTSLMIIGCTTRPSTQTSNATQVKEPPNFWEKRRASLVHDRLGRVPYHEEKAP